MAISKAGHTALRIAMRHTNIDKRAKVRLLRVKKKKYRLRLCVDTTALRSWIGRSSETAKAHRG
eukprot:TRINITY_DN2256_c0_g1_i1.p2 TRINITY_DN2256_c0_g1~~TRINITY_DN2256_c0_g1_i1.p2  ORF type:complete len:64 (+),score=24.22 TRINITY_DN2256_c0_g1_i1:28-219(+)